MFQVRFGNNFKPLTDDVPALLEKAAETQRTSIHEMAQKTLPSELAQPFVDMNASLHLADALEAKANALKQAITLYNQHNGHIPVQIMQTIAGSFSNSSHRMEQALLAYGLMVGNMQSNNPELRTQRVSTLEESIHTLEQLQERANAIETTIAQSAYSAKPLQRSARR